MSYRLHFNPDSCNLVVRMILEQLGQAYTAIEAPRNRSDRDAKFFSLNPFGLLPVLEDLQNGAILFETAACCIYLADKHRSLLPQAENGPKRADALKWLLSLANGLHPELIMQFYTERYVATADDITGFREKGRRRVLEHLRICEKVVASNGPWFMGSGLTVIDFYFGCLLRWSQTYPVEQPAIQPEDLRSFPSILALLDELSRTPAAMAALAAEGLSGAPFINPRPGAAPRRADKF